MAPVYELKGLSSPYDGSPSRDGVLPHAQSLRARIVPGRETDAEALAARFQHWRELEPDLARGLGISLAVHG